MNRTPEIEIQVDGYWNDTVAHCTKYHIFVKRDDIEIGSADHRFNEFRSLHMRLKSTGTFEFPCRGSFKFGDFHEHSVLNERRDQFEKYLRACLQVCAESSTMPPVLWKFLGLSGDPFIIEDIGTGSADRVRRLSEPVSPIPQPDFSDAVPTGPRPIKRLLIIGEIRDGKSTMVNGLRDPERSLEAVATRGVRGVTKDVTVYRGKAIRGHEIEIIDTPGIGDRDIDLDKLITLLEITLTHKERDIHGVIVTSPVVNGAVKLGGQLVHLLTSLGFKDEGNGEKWNHVILAGTRADIVSVEDKEYFASDIVPDFFREAPAKTGLYAIVHKGDYSQLDDAIMKLPTVSIEYEAPAADTLAEGVAGMMGLDASKFEGQLQQWREDKVALEAQIESAQAESERRLAEVLAHAAESQKVSEEKLASMQAAAEEANRAAAQANANAEQLRKEVVEERERGEKEEAKRAEEAKAREVEEAKRAEEAKARSPQPTVGYLVHTSYDSGGSSSRSSRSSGKTVHVKAYTRADGTKVKAHTRSAPGSKR